MIVDITSNTVMQLINTAAIITTIVYLITMARRFLNDGRQRMEACVERTSELAQNAKASADTVSQSMQQLTNKIDAAGVSGKDIADEIKVVLTEVKVAAQETPKVFDRAIAKYQAPVVDTLYTYKVFGWLVVAGAVFSLYPTIKEIIRDVKSYVDSNITVNEAGPKKKKVGWTDGDVCKVEIIGHGIQCSSKDGTVVVDYEEDDLLTMFDKIYSEPLKMKFAKIQEYYSCTDVDAARIFNLMTQLHKSRGDIVLPNITDEVLRPFIQGNRGVQVPELVKLAMSEFNLDSEDDAYALVLRAIALDKFGVGVDIVEEVTQSKGKKVTRGDVDAMLTGEDEPEAAFFNLMNLITTGGQTVIILQLMMEGWALLFNNKGAVQRLAKKMRGIVLLGAVGGFLWKSFKGSNVDLPINTNKAVENMFKPTAVSYDPQLEGEGAQKPKFKCVNGTGGKYRTWLLTDGEDVYHNCICIFRSGRYYYHQCRSEEAGIDDIISMDPMPKMRSSVVSLWEKLTGRGYEVEHWSTTFLVIFIVVGVLLYFVYNYVESKKEDIKDFKRSVDPKDKGVVTIKELDPKVKNESKATVMVSVATQTDDGEEHVVKIPATATQEVSVRVEQANATTTDTWTMKDGNSTVSTMQGTMVDIYDAQDANEAVDIVRKIMPPSDVQQKIHEKVMEKVSLKKQEVQQKIHEKVMEKVEERKKEEDGEWVKVEKKRRKKKVPGVAGGSNPNSQNLSKPSYVTADEYYRHQNYYDKLQGIDWEYDADEELVLEEDQFDALAEEYWRINYADASRYHESKKSESGKLDDKTKKAVDQAVTATIKRLGADKATPAKEEPKKEPKKAKKGKTNQKNESVTAKPKDTKKAPVVVKDVAPKAGASDDCIHGDKCALLTCTKKHTSARDAYIRGLQNPKPESSPKPEAKPENVKLESAIPGKKPIDVKTVEGALLFVDDAEGVGNSFRVHGGYIITAEHVIKGSQATFESSQAGVDDLVIDRADFVNFGVDDVAAAKIQNWSKATSLKLGEAKNGTCAIYAIVEEGGKRKLKCAEGNMTVRDNVIQHNCWTDDGWSGAAIIQNGCAVGIHLSGGDKGVNYGRTFRKEFAQFFLDGAGH